ncbi:nuclear transport factor 2 family protein [Algoriphagus taiwanensis]|uniref:Nuclear transport factor 2 family protein n=1 Tax=Algoriphagus taiwanensis TaxID=1445656 RepID=A0ABQ6PW37_9BACT|nr:nuclear transport factor 2 family protein [Algoriphagus taiwanensis]
MKYILILFLGLFSQIGLAQSTEEIEKAVQKMKVAMLESDAATLAELTSPALSYGHSGGTIETQSEFLEVFSSKSADYQRWDMSDLFIVIHNKTTAIVRHEVDADIESNGTLNNLKLGVMMVWVKEKGKWKLLGRQAFRRP